MSGAVVVVDQLLPQPVGAGWMYCRTWYCAGHPQSGINWILAVGQYAIMSEYEAMQEVVRLGLPELADKQMFGVWCNTGLIH